MRLDRYTSGSFQRGASRVKEALWIAISGVFFDSWIPGSGWRCRLLRLFGAQLGIGVVIKPYVTIKFPWKLIIGDHVWIGERAWIDNLAEVTIGSHSCISQSAYLCTGSHDWTDPEFGLITRPIQIGNGCWVGARSSLAPGTTMEDGSILAMNTLGTGHLEANTIYRADHTTRPRKRASTLEP